VIGGALPAALAAAWLTSVWDQNAGITSVLPAAAIVEEVAGRWLDESLALPPAASFAFVTGCQIAHVSIRAMRISVSNWQTNANDLARVVASVSRCVSS
jgi:aromatic-L-amino-acid decarboxylase